MDDMSVSGSLSIKAGKVGGSGKGSFVDSDKSKESDLNFYISVKVVNQTINFKDALVFNPLRSVDISDMNKFQEVYGDSFVSGFVEGGEFNAIGEHEDPQQGEENRHPSLSKDRPNRRGYSD